MIQPLRTHPRLGRTDLPSSLQDRPDVAQMWVAHDSAGMDGEADPATASLEQALFWRNVYSAILTMQQAVTEGTQQLMVLMAGQSPRARREVELTNVPRVVAHAERFRSRLGRWESRVRAHQQGGIQ